MEFYVVNHKTSVAMTRPVPSYFSNIFVYGTSSKSNITPIINTEWAQQEAPLICQSKPNAVGISRDWNNKKIIVGDFSGDRQKLLQIICSALSAVLQNFIFKLLQPRILGGLSQKFASIRDGPVTNLTIVRINVLSIRKSHSAPYV